MKNTEINIDGKPAMGVEVALPKAPLVLVHAPGGFVMCGYLNIETANKLGVPAAMVRGVSTVNDLLAASIVEMSDAAAEKGVQIGMSGQDALKRLF